MLISFYLFITPFLIVIFYISYKFFIYKDDINKLETNAFINDKDKNNFADALDVLFVFLGRVKDWIDKTLVVFLHWVLHFFVIFLKFVSDIADVLYTNARDFFLKTATKEKRAVSTFWNHLKEYKKEKEEEDTREEK